MILFYGSLPIFYNRLGFINPGLTLSEILCVSLSETMLSGSEILCVSWHFMIWDSGWKNQTFARGSEISELTVSEPESGPTVMFQNNKLLSSSDPHQLRFYLTYILTLYLAFCLTYNLTFYRAFFLAYILTFHQSFYLTFYLPSLLTFYLTCCLTFYLTF